MATVTDFDTVAIADERPWRLVILRAAWEQAVRMMLLDREQWAVGGLDWNPTTSARELLADKLELTREPPSGQPLAPLADWLTIRILPQGTSLQARLVDEIAASLHPRRTQRLVLVVLDGNRRTTWDAAIYRENHCERLDDLRIVGARMLRLSRETDREDSAATTPAEGLPGRSEVRSSRTSGALGPHVARLVRRSSVTLVGAGRTGSMLAFQLAGLGIERLRILDRDLLGEENLDAMPGLAVADLGEPKVVALARRLLEFRPDLSLTTLVAAVQGEAATRFLRERADLLVTAVDNDTPRLAVSRIARQTLTVHLDVGTNIQRRAAPAGSTRIDFEITGDARLLLPALGCVACVGGLLGLAEAQQDLAAPPGSLGRRIARPWHAERAGSLAAINSLTVGAAVLMWLDLLAGRQRTSFWQRLAWTPNGLESHASPVGPNDLCPFCRP